MRRFRQILAISLVLHQVLLFCGCSGYKDIDKRLFVIGLGIDRAGDSKPLYQVTVCTSIPSLGSKNANFKSLTFSVETNSIPEAIPKIQAQADKELDFSFTKLVILGKRMAHGDLSFVLDWLIRRRDIQKIAYLALGEPNAKSIFEQYSPLQNVPPNFLTLAFSGSGSQSNYVTRAYLFDFFRRTRELGLDPFLPVVESGQHGYKIEKVALFGKGERFRAQVILSPDETQIFNLISQNQNHLNIRVKNAHDDFVIKVHHVKHHYSIMANHKANPELHLYINNQGVVEASRRLIVPKQLPIYEDLSSKVIKRRVARLLKKLQAEGLDPFGFGLHYRATHWDNETKWQKWQMLYPKIGLKITVDTQLNSTGLIK